MDVCVGGDGRSHVDPDGRRVDQLHAADPLCLDVADVVGHGCAFREGFQGRHEALQDERRLSRPRDARHDRQAPLGNVKRQGLHRMDRPGFEMNAPQVEEVFGIRALRSEKGMLRKIGSDLRSGILPDDLERPLRQNPSALDARPGAEFDQMVDFREKRRVVVDQEDGIAVRDEVADHARETLEVRGVKPDRGFVQHIEDARRAVSHGARQLHALPLARRERRARAVEREVGKTQIHEAPCGRPKGFGEIFRHRAHGFGKRRGEPLDPAGEVLERHAAGFVQRDSRDFRRPGRSGESSAPAVGTRNRAQEAFDPLHPLFVLHLREGVFHRVDRVEEGEVQGRRAFSVLGTVEDVLLDGGTFKDDFPFFGREVAEGNVRAHAHGAADVRHEGPHERVPGRDRPFVDREALVGHEGRAIDRAHDARAAASLARPASVEGQLFGRGREKVRAALGTDEFLSGRDVRRGRDAVAVGTAVRSQAREDEAKNVQEFRPRSEGAPKTRHARPLSERERRGNVEDFVHFGAGRLRHAAPRVGGKGLEIAARTFGVEYAERQRRLSRPRDARDAHDFVKRHVHVDVLEIVHARAAHLDVVPKHAFLLRSFRGKCSALKRSAGFRPRRTKWLRKTVTRRPSQERTSCRSRSPDT